MSMLAAQERIATLRSMAEQGFTYACAAKALGISRSSVAGLAARNGIIFGKDGKRAAVPRAALRRAGYRRWPLFFRREVTVDAEHLSSPISHAAAPEQSGCPAGAVPFEELPASGCRWPSGEGEEMRFCGAARLADKPYCFRHCLIAYPRFPARHVEQ